MRDARKMQRVPFTRNILINGRVMVRSIDISEGGLYVHTGRSHITGQVVDVQIPCAGEVLKVRARVSRSEEAIGMGLMISSLAVTQQQGMLGAFLFLVPAIILSGFATPIANMPSLVQDLTLVNPMRYFLVIIRGVFLEGTPFHLLIHQFWPMAVIGVVALTFAGWLFRHRMY